jgi:hypothetical protein
MADQGIVRELESVAAEFQCPNAAVGFRRVILGENPAVQISAVECNVKRAVIVGVGRAPAACAEVARREDAANEPNEDQGMPPVVTQRVEVPPGIAVGWNW